MELSRADYHKQIAQIRHLTNTQHYSFYCIKQIEQRSLLNHIKYIPSLFDITRAMNNEAINE